MRRIALHAALFAVVSPAGADVLPTSLVALNDALLRLALEGPRSHAFVDLPVGDGRVSRFDVRDSRTLPVSLSRRFPGLRSFRGTDAEGRTARLDLAAGGVRLAIGAGASEWEAVARTAEQWHALSAPAIAATNDDDATSAPLRHIVTRVSMPVPRGLHDSLPTARSGGTVRYDIRLAVAVGSRLAGAWGTTVEDVLGEVAHRVNRANEVFETDVGVHFSLVDASDRLVMMRRSRDPFPRGDPAPAAVGLIDRIVGAANYDAGHAMLDLDGGESDVGTSCSDARDDDFLATHKAAAWSDGSGATRHALDRFIHVLGRQLGAWPTANGCQRDTLDDRAFEPGSGTTAMSYAFGTCRQQSVLQSHADRYFHAANIEQMHDWLAGAGGHCLSKRLLPVASPWIDPRSLDRRILVPARTPFTLSAHALPGEAGRRLTYTWEQMDAGEEQRGALIDDGHGPLVRSFPPSPAAHRDIPGFAGAPGETLPTSSRQLSFRLTVRDNGGDAATTASADVRVQTVDTGRAFAFLSHDHGQRVTAGAPMAVRWDVAGTDAPPLSCHFVHIDLSTDAGVSWRRIAIDEPNDGAASPVLPDDAGGTHARLRIRCDNRPFFAESPEDIPIEGTPVPKTSPMSRTHAAHNADTRYSDPLQRG